MTRHVFGDNEASRSKCREGLLKTSTFCAGQSSVQRYDGLYICLMNRHRHLVLLARHPLSIKGVFSAGHATKAFRDRA